MEDQGITFQEIIQCLEEQGSLTFEVSKIDLENIRIERSISIKGSPDFSTSITCMDGPIFSISSNEVIISNLVINDCRLEDIDAPVVLRTNSSLELNSVNFTNNVNAAGSAVLRMERSSKLVISDSTFLRNYGVAANVLSADPGCDIDISRSLFRGNGGEGSTLSITDGSLLTITNSRFVNNQASHGGGVFRIQSSADERSSVVIQEGSEFRNNKALMEGGVIFVNGNVSLEIKEDTIFSNNQAAQQGGALFVVGPASVRISDAYFIENESFFLGGGAIFAEYFDFGGLDIHISNTLFSQNVASNQLGSGGAIRLQGIGVHCVMDHGVSFTLNHAKFDGGAIHVTNVPLMILRHTSFIGNEVLNGGAAAMYVVSTMDVGLDTMVLELRIESCSFWFNTAASTNRGGSTVGLVGPRTEVFIEGSKFHQNECSEGSGAAIYIFDGPVVEISNSTFADNKATWGGAIYAEMSANCYIINSIFYKNQAQEGGAISTRGKVDLEIVETRFVNNSAKVDGGAIKSENHDLSGGSNALFTLHSNIFTNNNAGEDLADKSVQSRANRGGGILVVGQGQYVRITDTTFLNNSALEGGGMAVIGPRQFTISGQSKFEANVANFGGGIFTIVDNSVDIVGGHYRIESVEFVDNMANSDGGGIRVSSWNSNNNLFPFNADAITISMSNCTVKSNMAIRVGGGLAAIGVGLKVDNGQFVNNTVLPVSIQSSVGLGGAIAISDGTSAHVESSSFVHNAASLMGGAAYIMDSSLFISSSNFSFNLVNRGDSNGGALALYLSSDRLIPLLGGGNKQRNVLLECNDCHFVNNSAARYGGAVYHYHSSPNANYTDLWSCENDLVAELGRLLEEAQLDLTCLNTITIRNRLQNRVVRLARVMFKGNQAESGAALFTNHPAMINITNGSIESDGVPFIKQAQDGGSALERLGITFSNNMISEDGYGKNFASYPVRALLFSEDADEGKEGVSTLTFSKFRSGDRLRFDIEFQDAFGQNVTSFANFTGELVYDSVSSGNAPLELSGQTSGRVEADGCMRFSGSKLEGQSGRNYILKLQYLLRGRELMMEMPLLINVTMRPCRIGEFTRIDNEVIECLDCGAGTFSSNASRQKCRSCEDMDGGQCFGRVAVPEDHYWHSSSFSLKMTRCIGQEACSYNGRFKKLNKTETEAHLKGKEISYTNGDNTQCSRGYEGILCGSCEPGYGREADRCQKCVSKGVRYFVVLVLILWAVLFLGYFVRSVIQLSARIEFNKKFGMSVRQSAQKLITPVEQLPSTSNFPDKIETGDQINTGSEVSIGLQPSIGRPRGQAMLTRQATNHEINVAIVNEVQIQRQRSKSHESRNMTSANDLATRKRQTQLATKLQQIQNDPTQHSVALLTLGNPVAEVLKILINFLQVTSMAVSINMDWTDAVRKTLLVLGTAGNLAGGTGYFSLDCFLTSGSVPKSLRRMIFAILYPLCIFILFALFWAFRALARRQNYRILLQRIWLSFLSITYFFYIGLTKDLLRFFACVKIDEDTENLEDAELASPLEDSYWEEDTSVKCYSHRHALVVGILVIPFLCAVSLGYPLGTLFILHSNRENLNDEDFIGTYGFLYRSYDKHYWEFMIMLRKALIATVAVFAYGLGVNIQGLLCVLILVASLGLHLTFMPFTKEIPQLNRLESWSISTTIAVFVSGLIFNDPKSETGSKIFLSTLAISLICVTLGLILLALLSASEELIDMVLLEHGIMDCYSLCDARLSLKLEKLVLHYMSRVTRFGEGMAEVFSSKKQDPAPSQNTPQQMNNI
eukprot:g3550.t1